MDLHNSSLRDFDVRKMQPQPDTRPHYILRRYAEFTCALLICSQASFRCIDPRLQRCLSKQQAEIENFLNRLAGQMASPVQKLVCFINNYDLILTIFEERATFDSKEKSSFWESQQRRINEYVDLMLRPHFGDLIAFVNECEPLIEQGHKQLLTSYSGARFHFNRVGTIVRSFSVNWKRSVDAVNREIVYSFTNFKNGTNILQPPNGYEEKEAHPVFCYCDRPTAVLLFGNNRTSKHDGDSATTGIAPIWKFQCVFQAAFTQIVQYYHRFSKVLSHEVFAENAVLKELVNIHHIMVELKKYKPVY
ncbi:unnamed protein product [Gongylonema pulchrum]|uniref:Vacuolar protein sorting-associated protein 52 homolog n=1 Tax=Gongylonema pulchrum TaxID=637853 RepID=A0A183DRT0_9BILA|nr:unnamed protein product [Gongylonema pulchrum]